MTLYYNYAKGMNANDEVITWINTVLKNRLKKFQPDQTEVEHIIDYMVSTSAPKRLLKMSYPEAKNNTKKWSEANQKKGKNLIDSNNDIEVVHNFSDGCTVVKLKTKKAFKREGFLMSHCVGAYDPNNEIIQIYSYRDKKNLPHATFEVRSSGDEVTQIKGKGNGSIHPKYIDAILVFLTSIGRTIRPYDMKYLGYQHLPKQLVEWISELKGVKEPIYKIMGESYLVVGV